MRDEIESSSWLVVGGSLGVFLLLIAHVQQLLKRQLTTNYQQANR